MVITVTSDIFFQSSALLIYTLMCVGMVGRLQVFFLQSDKLNGGPMYFCRKNSGWGKVAIRWLACIGPDGFQTISFSFWLMYGYL